MINNFEVELAQTVDELKKEKEKSAQTIRHLKEDVRDLNITLSSIISSLSHPSLSFFCFLSSDHYETVKALNYFILRMHLNLVII